MLEQAGFPVVGPAGHPRRLGPPARPARVPRRVARRAARPTARAAARRAGRRAARAARVRRGALRRRGRAAAGAGGVQALPVPGHAGARRPSASSSCIPPTGHTADGMAIWIAVARRARVRRLPLAGRDPDDLARAARSTPTSATLERPAARWSSSRRVVPGHGGPIAARARAGDPREDLRLPRRARARRRRSAAARGPPERRPARDPRANDRHAENGPTLEAVLGRSADHGERVAGGDRARPRRSAARRPCPPCAR